MIAAAIAFFLIDLLLLRCLRTGRIFIAPSYRFRVIDRRDNALIFWLVWALYLLGTNVALVRCLTRL